MIEADGFAPLGLNSEPHAVPHLDDPTDHPAAVHDQGRLRFLRVEDFYQVPARGLHPADIADLTTGLAVEGSLGGDDFNLLALAHRTGATLSLNERGQDLGFPLDDAVA